MRNFLTLVFWLCALFSLQAQEQGRENKITENGKTYLLHKVSPGETLYSIGKEYNIELTVLSQVNPQVAKGLRSGDILKIPVAGEGVTSKNEQVNNKTVSFIIHKVQRKETFYFISHKYGITIDDILEYNPGVTQLKKGQTLRIPQWTTTPARVEATPCGTAIPAGTIITHFVQPGETLNSISRKYGKSVSAILEMNPDARELKPGMRLKIPSVPSASENASQEENYEKHTVEKGETLFSLSRRFRVTADRLVELNPSLEKTCKAGSVIRIPVMLNKSNSGTTLQGKEEIHHIVKSGETLYGLSQVYHIPMWEIIRYNPFLENRSPRTGDTLLIVTGNLTAENLHRNVVGREMTAVEKSPECAPRAAYHSNNNTYKIAMLLPVMIEANRSLNEEFLANPPGHGNEISANGSDTLKVADKPVSKIQFQGNSENYIHFYEGVLLAIDSLQQMGIKIELNVWDTEQKPSKVKNFISSGVLNNTDLIIGPVYSNEQKEISDFALKHRIPVVSPLSPSDEYTKENPYFFQVNPTREFISAKTTEYLISSFENSNIVVLQTSSSGNEAENEVSRLKSELLKNGRSSNSTTIRICNFKKEGFAGLREKMINDRKNIIVVLSGNEAEVSVVVSNLNSIASDFDVTLIGNSRFPQFESINPDNYHRGRLEFLTPYWPDNENPVTRSFINKFRSYFKAEPNQYSMQGYDVTFFFVKAMNDFGTDFWGCIGSENAGLVQGTYHFNKLSSGGYINNGLSVVQYSPTYEIIKKKVITN